jgi:hypothetical protein
VNGAASRTDVAFEMIAGGNLQRDGLAAGSTELHVRHPLLAGLAHAVTRRVCKRLAF